MYTVCTPVTIASIMYPFLLPTDSAGTILSSSVCLPRSKEAQSTRSHLAINLLSCLSTLTTHPPLTIEALAGQGRGKYDKDDFNSVVRFNGKLATQCFCDVIGILLCCMYM